MTPNYSTPNRQNIQPIQHHHSLNQISPHIHMNPIVFVSLNTHILSPKMLHAPPPHFKFHDAFINHQCFVSLADQPLILFLFACCVGGDEETGPEVFGA
jgi:hypothetical protein